MSSSAAPPARAVCVVRDPALRRTLRRSLCGSAADVEFRESLEGALEPDAILFLDLDARTGAGSARAIGPRGRTVMLGSSLGHSEMLSLLSEGGLDHVIADRGPPDEHELSVTAAKLHSGDIFGLEKYVAWGVPVAELEVASYDDKSAALARLGEAARSVGARRQMVNRILGSADELLMNALYDAPAARGERPAPEARGRARADSPALLRYACDGRHLALSVLDRFGTLDKRAAIDAVLRARADLGRPRAEGGAGLGLYFVLSSVTRFIVNLHPGRRTEVVCLFDLREHPHDSTGWTRSLHVFTTPAASD